MSNGDDREKYIHQRLTESQGVVELGSQDGRKYTLELRAELAVGLAVCRR